MAEQVSPLTKTLWIFCAAPTGAVLATAVFLFVAMVVLREIEFHGEGWHILLRVAPVAGLGLGAFFGIRYLKTHSQGVPAKVWWAVVMIGVVFPLSVYPATELL